MKIDEQSPSFALILLGPPGAGKGTQCKALTDVLHLPHVATGDVLREQIRRGTRLGCTVQEIMDSGNLVPNSIVLDLLEQRIAKGDCAKGFLLDGFPRSSEQARLLDQRLSKSAHATIVLRLLVSQTTLLQRLVSRQVCPSCGTPRAASTASWQM